jgi:nucleoside-diphosphate-sugar epimerase/carbamoylphosphate synthase large subunit
MIKVLVTSVGGGVGQSVVDSISHLRDSYFIIGLDINENIYAKNQCDKFILSKRISEEDYIESLLFICKENSIDVLIPGNDGELGLLSENLPLFDSIGVSVVVSPAKIVESSRDKCQWYSDYSDNINIVPTIKLHDYIAEYSLYPEITYPAIAKPAAGSASSGIMIFDSFDDILFVIDRLDSNYVIQPYLFPHKDDPDFHLIKRSVANKKLLQVSEISCQIVYSKESEVLGVFVSKNSLKNGVPVTVEPVNDSYILNEVNRVADFLKNEKVIGPVNIQGRLTDNGLVFFEMNLRFTGITGNRSLFGFNEVACVIDSFVGKAFPGKLGLNMHKVGARQVACRTSYLSGKKIISTILIVGASSWTAKNLVVYLAKIGYLDNKNVILSSRNPLSTEGLYRDLLNISNYRIKFVSSELSDLDTCVNLSDVVVNFLSARPTHGNDNIISSTKVNLHLTDIIKRANVGLVINASSQSVYPRNTQEIKSEDSETFPNSIYGFSKKIVEDSFSSIRSFNRNCQIVNLRLARLWGGSVSLQKGQMPYNLINAYFGNEQFLVSNRDNRINLLDVDDLSSFVVNLFSAYEREKKIPELMNVGGHDVCLREYVDFLNDLGISHCSRIDYNESSVLDSLQISSDLAIKNEFLELTPLKDTWSKSIELFNTMKGDGKC